MIKEYMYIALYILGPVIPDPMLFLQTNNV